MISHDKLDKLQGNHKFYTSLFLHKINLTSTKLTLKSFDNQPLEQKKKIN